MSFGRTHVLLIVGYDICRSAVVEIESLILSYIYGISSGQCRTVPPGQDRVRTDRHVSLTRSLR